MDLQSAAFREEKRGEPANNNWMSKRRNEMKFKRTCKQRCKTTTYNWMKSTLPPLT